MLDAGEAGVEDGGVGDDEVEGGDGVVGAQGADGGEGVGVGGGVDFDDDSFAVGAGGEGV